MGLWVRVPISLLHFVNMHFKVWAKTRTYIPERQHRLGVLIFFLRSNETLVSRCRIRRERP